MTVASFEGKIPRIGEGSYVHPSADVFGDVTIGRGCWVGPGARIRGDYGTIVLGDYCSVEDNCVIHARPGEQTTIGDWVTLGHGAVIHNVKLVGDYAIIGMGGIVSDWVVIGRTCLSLPAVTMSRSGRYGRRQHVELSLAPVKCPGRAVRADAVNLSAVDPVRTQYLQSDRFCVNALELMCTVSLIVPFDVGHLPPLQRPREIE